MEFLQSLNVAQLAGLVGVCVAGLGLIGPQLSKAPDLVRAAARRLRPAAPPTVMVAPSEAERADLQAGCRAAVLRCLRHKAAELTDPHERNDALAVCDQIDGLAKRLFAAATLTKDLSPGQLLEEAVSWGNA